MRILGFVLLVITACVLALVLADPVQGHETGRRQSRKERRKARKEKKGARRLADDQPDDKTQKVASFLKTAVAEYQASVARRRLAAAQESQQSTRSSAVPNAQPGRRLCGLGSVGCLNQLGVGSGAASLLGGDFTSAAALLNNLGFAGGRGLGQAGSTLLGTLGTGGIGIGGIGSGIGGIGGGIGSGIGSGGGSGSDLYLGNRKAMLGSLGLGSSGGLQMPGGYPALSNIDIASILTNGLGTCGGTGGCGASGVSPSSSRTVVEDVRLGVQLFPFSTTLLGGRTPTTSCTACSRNPAVGTDLQSARLVANTIRGDIRQLLIVLGALLPQQSNDAQNECDLGLGAGFGCLGSNTMLRQTFPGLFTAWGGGSRRLQAMAFPSMQALPSSQGLPGLTSAELVLYQRLTSATSHALAAASNLVAQLEVAAAYFTQSKAPGGLTQSLSSLGNGIQQVNGSPTDSAGWGAVYKAMSDLRDNLEVLPLQIQIPQEQLLGIANAASGMTTVMNGLGVLGDSKDLPRLDTQQFASALESVMDALAGLEGHQFTANLGCLGCTHSGSTSSIGAGSLLTEGLPTFTISDVGGIASGIKKQLDITASTRMSIPTLAIPSFGQTNPCADPNAACLTRELQELQARLEARKPNIVSNIMELTQLRNVLLRIRQSFENLLSPCGGAATSAVSTCVKDQIAVIDSTVSQASLLAEALSQIVSVWQLNVNNVGATVQQPTPASTTSNVYSILNSLGRSVDFSSRFAEIGSTAFQGLAAEKAAAGNVKNRVTAHRLLQAVIGPPNTNSTSPKSATAVVPREHHPHDPRNNATSALAYLAASTSITRLVDILIMTIVLNVPECSSDLRVLHAVAKRRLQQTGPRQTITVDSMTKLCEAKQNATDLFLANGMRTLMHLEVLRLAANANATREDFQRAETCDLEVTRLLS